MSISALVLLYPHGNLTLVDAFFFGASASTGTGLDTVNAKELTAYQQLYLYVISMLSSVGFINVVVVVRRLYRFQKHLKEDSTTCESFQDFYADNGGEQEDEQTRAVGLAAVTAQEHNIAQPCRSATIPITTVEKSLLTNYRSKKIVGASSDPEDYLSETTPLLAVGQPQSHAISLQLQDFDGLGGIEYSSMKLLFKINLFYYFGLHIFGVICLLLWVQYASPTYTGYINKCGQSSIWW
ncbi:uncharacterized protein BDV17DRAFT_296612 [Aspergillus undulatus]|uniref:uncharacterized protein n=1 Tax=Aspergillus undulatus TaxID=1810928 RepID=UPI003CCCFA18